MTVIYDAENHFGVIFQLHGSVWGKVLPWCLWNTALTLMIWSLNSHDIVDLTLDGGRGYQYISVLVSFFVVSNVGNAISRLWEARGLLGTMLHAAEMLASRAAVYSSHETSEKADAWRTKVKEGLIDLIQSSLSLIQDENAAVLFTLLGSEEIMQTSTSPRDAFKKSKDTHPSVRSLLDTTDLDKHAWRNSILVSKTKKIFQQKDPHMVQSQLDMTIISQSSHLDEPLTAPRENDLLGRTSAFMDAFVGLLKFGTTPRPFVTVQMGRTITLLWILTLPFAVTDQHEKSIVEALIIVFMVTYGFIGLTMADIELHDPLGTDPNDLECQKIAAQTIQGIRQYLEMGIVDPSLVPTSPLMAQAMASATNLSRRATDGSTFCFSYGSLSSGEEEHDEEKGVTEAF